MAHQEEAIHIGRVRIHGLYGFTFLPTKIVPMPFLDFVVKSVWDFIQPFISSAYGHTFSCFLQKTYLKDRSSRSGSRLKESCGMDMKAP